MSETTRWNATTRRWAWVLGWSLVAFVLYSVLGMNRYARGMSGAYDLGIFTQAAYGWISGQGPVSAIKGGSLFADHFSPVTILFGGAYAIWRDPRALIAAQSLTLAIAVGMVASDALRRIGSAVRAAPVLAALVLGLPLITAATVAPHESALGAPAYAGLCLAVAGRRWPAAILWSLGCLCVKEDSGLIVAAAGLAWLLAHREWRPAIGLAALGAGGFLVSNGVIWWMRGSASPYYSYVLDGAADANPLARLLPAAILLVAAGFVVRDPLLLTALPVIGWRMASGNTHYWFPKYHYDVFSGIVGAVVFVGALASERTWRVLRVAAVLLALYFGGSYVADETPWRANPLATPAKAVAVERLLARLPAGQPLAADQSVNPYVPPEFSASMFALDREGTLGLTPPQPACWVLLDPSNGDISGTAAAKQAWLAGRTSYREGRVVAAATGDPGCPSPPPPSP